MNVLLCPLSDPGFLYPALAVGRELRERGHSVQVLARRTAAAVVEEAELVPLPADEVGEDRAFSVARAGASAVPQFEAVQRAARATNADVLVTSLLCHGGLLAAERLDLPATVLGLAVYLWPYQRGGVDDPLSDHRQRLLHELLRHYQTVRGIVGMSRRPDQSPPTGAGLLLRGDAALEYPGATLPAGARQVGPCQWEPRPDPVEVARVAAAVDRVGKPVVYVHLGRTFGGASLWPRLNAAFTGGSFQAIVELGRSGAAEPSPEADLVVVRQPGMEPFLSMARAVLTNGTSAPVLAGLRHDLPLIVAPNGAEQPLLAEACLRTGVALRLPERAGPQVQAVIRVACQSSQLRRRAAWLGARLRRAGGAASAATAALAAVTGRPAVMAADGR